ncbi:MAG TPA: DUF72 domain-containing protein [Isosphaeraceae bacterium]
MSLFPSFEAEDRPEQAARLAPRLRKLAARGVYFGTSSWKYEGWLGTIYRPGRYDTHGKFSTAKFRRECLAEYAETFPTVCGDFAFYQFPTADYWAQLFAATPPEFLFGFKVPEDITVARWPGHGRYGTRAGLENEHFLDAAAFRRHFAGPLEPYRGRVATLIFEFGTFGRSTFPRPEDFFERLDPFLAALPPGFRYSVEIRNPEFLGPAYFSLLRDRGVAHVFNAWTRMPRLDEQVALPGAFTADFTVVRALLAQGRAYEDAVRAFTPYRAVQVPNIPTREAMGRVVERALREKEPAYVFVNNRLEGFAPATIEAVAESLAP